MVGDYKLIVAGLSTALGTATRSESPDLALPSSYADDWGERDHERRAHQRRGRRSWATC